MSMDGARAATRGDAWKKIHRVCACGITVYGNGRQHERRCPSNLRERGWPLAKGMLAVLRESGLRASHIVAIERALGQRSLAGDRPELLGWRDFRDLVWRLAEEAKRGEQR
jgi:hypothetical protein